jgi:hypothetical protein
VLINAGVSGNDCQVGIAANGGNQIVPMPCVRSTTALVEWAFVISNLWQYRQRTSLQAGSPWQCVSQHREPLVRFVGAHPGSVECFQKQVVILESVADGELDGFASFLFA